jgi:hypothetical protein
MDGKSLVKICEEDGMPSRRTVLYWLDEKPEFCAKCARAREMQADLMDDGVIDLIRTTRPETAASDRVKLAAMQWRASKLAPKKYGDLTKHEVTGADGGPLEATVVILPSNGRE